ncbi:MAG TPA: M28 family peptidase [Gemmatimonadaceae bacterium]
MSIFRSLPLRALQLAVVAASALVAGESAAQAPSPASPSRPLPLKYAGPPTVADITAGDLMTRVYKFADDSMMGRAFGTPYNDKATAYIAAELERLGLQPAGDGGTFFQKVPIVNRQLDSASTITVEGTTYRAFEDFVAGGPGSAAGLAGAAVIYLGSVVDTAGIVPADSVRGKVAFVRLAALPPGTNPQEFVQSPGYLAFLESLEAAAAIVTIAGQQLSPMALRMASNPATSVMLEPEAPIAITVTQRLAEAVLGGPLDQVRRGAVGKPITADVRLIDTPRPGRNVVAVVPGTDPALRGQYIAIGAHNDHVPPASTPVDHDSLRAVLQVVRPQGADSPNRPATPEEEVRIRAILDSLRRVNPPRLDSIRNGADDDASGSMTILEVAEAFALGREKPKRSILFVWHTGEEGGLLGARHFTANPTVPRDSIVAQLNLDMVGRGGAQDVTGEAIDGTLLNGGPGYVQLIGARRLSTELGDVIERVNTEAGLNLRFDYSMDANGHPQNIYCRSDHYEYAKYGIPVVFISTGGHADYHQVTDEPQYLDYPHMATVARLVHASALALANLDHRIVVDQPKPDPHGTCVQ